MIHIQRETTAFFCGAVFSALICTFIYLVLFPYNPRIWTAPNGTEYVIFTDGSGLYHVDDDGRVESKTDFDPEQESELGPEPVMEIEP